MRHLRSLGVYNKLKEGKRCTQLEIEKSSKKFRDGVFHFFRLYTSRDENPLPSRTVNNSLCLKNIL